MQRNTLFSPFFTLLKDKIPARATRELLQHVEKIQRQPALPSYGCLAMIGHCSGVRFNEQSVIAMVSMHPAVFITGLFNQSGTWLKQPVHFCHCGAFCY